MLKAGLLVAKTMPWDGRSHDVTYTPRMHTQWHDGTCRPHASMDAMSGRVQTAVDGWGRVD